RLGEDVALLDEARLDVLGRGHDARARERPRHVAAHERRQRVDHRREEDVQLLLLAEEQLAVVAGDALDGIAAVHGAAPLAELAALLLRRVRREDDVARVHAEGGEQAHPELVGGPEVQDASKPRKPDALPCCFRSPAQRAAPMAPASPEYGWSTTSASGTLPRMKSTCAFTTAMLRWVPPWSTNLRPAARRFCSCPA